MSSTTWTPTAVASSASAIRLDVWRAVEAQHRVSTMALVDNAAEQELLESLLDESKPPLPPGTEALHWLLFTPFRYPPPPHGSRFRGPADPGVFYGADDIRTACAELGYWRWRFLCDSPLEAIGAMPQTLFRVAVAGPAVDLRAPPFDAGRAQSTNPTRYEATQSLAAAARQTDVDIIRYESVRDPEHGGCGALLSVRSFADKRPLETQTWWLAISRERVTWKREDPMRPLGYEFEASTFPS